MLAGDPAPRAGDSPLTPIAASPFDIFIKTTLYKNMVLRVGTWTRSHDMTLLLAVS